MHLTSIVSVAVTILGVVSAQAQQQKQCQNCTIYCGRDLKALPQRNGVSRWTNDDIFNALVNKDGNNGPRRDQLNGKFNGALFKCTTEAGRNRPVRLTWVKTCGNGNCQIGGGGDGACTGRGQCL
ncbi:hypothetical protein CERZMDRAFT_86846 [Cercospora zeae-maydis SCOH1-5]|uniref:Ig-like domain-containing protein n=1 Tax=Cercospora zeae-maydis SCOH1-5 TaxID=717836 RepID=A0A6A6F6L9_9PEZI|nr:hypothetical protein CERZMDRAFT_86846 [Cercospora zeae-maydis SCOH1-5]